MNVTARPDSRRARWHRVLTRTRTSRALMALAAVSAAIATITDVPAVSAAPASTLVVEIWRLCGFALFTGLLVGYITARGWRSGRAGNGQLMTEPATRQVPAPM